MLCMRQMTSKSRVSGAPHPLFARRPAYTDVTWGSRLVLPLHRDGQTPVQPGPAAAVGPPADLRGRARRDAVPMRQRRPQLDRRPLHCPFHLRRRRRKRGGRRGRGLRPRGARRFVVVRRDGDLAEGRIGWVDGEMDPSHRQTDGLAAPARGRAAWTPQLTEQARLCRQTRRMRMRACAAAHPQELACVHIGCLHRCWRQP
jgi:hypothetical protein